MSKNKVLVIGETFLDENISGSAERLSPEAPVPVFNNGKSSFHLGGAANVAKNLANLELEVSLLTVLGNDNYSLKTKSLINFYGIRLLDNELSIKETMRKIRFIVNQQQLFRYDIENKISSDIAEYISLKIYDICFEYDLIIISDYNKGLLDKLNSKKLKSIFRKPLLIDSKSCKEDLISNASILKPNLSELKTICSLYGINEVNKEDQLIKIIKRFNIDSILLTMGSEGMMLCNKENNDINFSYIKPFERDVFDVTGAGDTVISVLGYCIANGMNLILSAEKANHVASISVSHLGTYTPTLKDLNYKKENIIVFTNGCFDIIHFGHIELLKACRNLGAKVIVGLNSDDSVKRLKGSERPFNNEKVRKTILENLVTVDEVLIFEEDTPYNLINTIKPNIIVKGGDYNPEEVIGKDIIDKYGGKVIIFPFVDNYSTTELSKKIKEHG